MNFWLQTYNYDEHSGELIFQLVILKRPNFQLMMMKNLIFSCPEKGSLRTNRDPCIRWLLGLISPPPGIRDTVAIMESAALVGF